MARPAHRFARPAPLAVERLEDRTTPAWTVSLVGNAVTFTGDGAADSLLLTTDAGGNLQHNVSGLTSSIDLDPAIGVQSRLATDLTSLTANGNGGTDFVQLTGLSVPGSITTEQFRWFAGTLVDADVVTTNTSLAVSDVPNPATLTLSGVTDFDLFGGTGNNTLDASGWTIAVYIEGRDGNDVLRGGSGNDDLRGNAGDDTLEGNGGNDILDVGNDTAFSGGNDTLRGGGGNDTLHAWDGSDILDGGTETDYVYDLVPATATLTDTTYTNGVTSTNHNVEDWEIYGDGNANTFDASAWTGAGLLVDGMGGNDVLKGGSGNDDLRGRAGDDTLEGNGGNDTLDVNSDPTWSGGGDTLRGGGGNDTLHAWDGNDVVDGGTETDTVYDYVPATATLTDTAYTNNGVTSTNHGVENWELYGDGNANIIDASAWTGAGLYLDGLGGNDTLKGGSGNDDLRGRGGDDTLEGNGGNDTLDVNSDPTWSGGGDTLRGGGGNDTLHAWDGDDVVDGGIGTDTVYDYVPASATLTDATYTNNSVASAGHAVEDWTLYGDGNANVIDASAWTGAGLYLDGLGGNDTLRGGAGNDDLRGRAGDDTLEGNGGADNLDVNSDLTWSAGNDTLRGGGGNDTLHAWDGDDVVDGGIGTDTVYDYVPASATLTDATYTNNSVASAGHAVEDWTLYGTAADNVIDASAWTGAGLYLDGLGGNDTIRGGAGNDDLRGRAGDDTLEGNGGNDNLDVNNDPTWSAGNDTLRGGDGNDHLHGHNGADILEGGDGNDNLYEQGTLEPGSLDGGAGTDTANIFLSSAADTLAVSATQVVRNGNALTYTNIESMPMDAGPGIDDGIQNGLVTTPYTVQRLEPTPLAGGNAVHVESYFNRFGSFRDIGDPGNTWTGTVNYGDGTGDIPLVINQAAKTYQLLHQYTSGGTFTVTVKIKDNQNNEGVATFLVYRPLALSIDTGGLQRSVIRGITITFFAPTDLGAGAITLTRLTGGPNPGVVQAVQDVGGQTVVTMSFTGTGEPGNQLADGRYRLRFDATKVTDRATGAELDGDGDGQPGGDLIFDFHRLFGDGNGDGTVNLTDFGEFGGAFGKGSAAPGYKYWFDHNQDGVINLTDFGAFGQRFGKGV